MKIGLVGTGHWASAIHAPCLASDPGVTFVGVWGRDRVKRTQLADAHAVRSFDDFDDMLEEVEGISFAVAPGIQCRLARRAAERGRHVLLEKPLALDLNDGFALTEAIRRSGVRSVIFLTRLFHPTLRSHIALAAQEENLTQGKVRIVSNSMRVPTPYTNSKWRQSPTAALWDLGPHALSVLQSVLGVILKIDASLDERGHVLLLVTHVNGASSTVELALMARDADIANETTFTCARGEIALPTIDMINGGAAEAYREAVCQLVNGDRFTPYCDASYGLELLKSLTECDEQLRLSRSD